MRIGTSAGILLALTASVVILGCGARARGPAAATSSRLTEDEKHRLYSAALAASESPLENETFKNVCRRIEIFDASGQPNEKYMAFVSAHVAWGMKSETDQFRREIDSKEKAREYIRRHLPH